MSLERKTPAVHTKDAIDKLVGNKWDKARSVFLNQNTLMLGGLATVCNALYQISTFTSRSSEAVRQNFSDIITALQNNTVVYDAVQNLAAQIATKSEQGINAALTQLMSIVNEQTENNEALAASAQGLEDHVAKTTSNYHTTVGMLVGIPAFTIGCALLVDFVKQVSTQPTNTSHVVAKVVTTAGLMTFLGVRAVECYSSEYKKAPGVFGCSQAEDPVNRGFINALIQIGYLAGANAAVRLINSFFKEGFKGTGQAIAETAASIPSGVSARASKIKQAATRFFFDAQPGDQITVKPAGEGAAELNITVGESTANSNSAASAPLLSRPGMSNSAGTTSG